MGFWVVRKRILGGGVAAMVLLVDERGEVMLLVERALVCQVRDEWGG